MARYREPKNIREKKAKIEARKNFWKVFLIEGILFFITSALAVFGAYKLNRLALAEKIYLPKTSWQDFLMSFLFITFFVLVFVVYKKAGEIKKIIYKILFIVAALWGGTIILNLFLPVLEAVLIMGFLIALWLKLSSVWAHDILMILGLAGVTAFFGLGFTPAIVIAILLGFSVYDFIAVYKTKHMVLMVKDMIENKAVLGFIIPKKIKYFKESLSKLKPGSDFMVLDGGDIVFPGLLAVSIIPSGLFKALVIVLFSSAGCLFAYWLFAKQENTNPMPALPPIALFSIIGYLSTLFF